MKPAIVIFLVTLFSLSMINRQADHLWTAANSASHFLSSYRNAPELNNNTFQEEERSNMTNRTQQDHIALAFITGATIALLVYILTSLPVSNYKPYHWAFIFLLAAGLCNLGFQNQLFHIAPTCAELNFIFALLFSGIGIISFYLLVIDMLRLDKRCRPYEQVARGIIIMVAMAVLFLVYNSSNHLITIQSKWLNISLTTVHVLYFASLIPYLWNKNDKMQRFLAYALIVILIGMVMLLYRLWNNHNHNSLSESLWTQLFVICITIILLMGIGFKTKQIEVEYHKSIESIVKHRTDELRKANHALHEQQFQLMQKNNYIETLIDEVNHRVKNNLQLLYSLGSLYKNKENHSIQYNLAIQAMQDRIHAMMLVNQLLVYNYSSQLKLDVLVLEIVSYLRQIYDPVESVRIKIDIARDWLISTHTSMPLALIITELLTNSYKYAFPLGDSRSPQITLRITKVDSSTVMTFKDNGVGKAELSDSTSFGLQLVRDLTRQIKGKVSIEHKQGFQFLFEFNNNI